MQNGRQVFRVLGTYNFSIYANETMYIHMIDRIKSKSSEVFRNYFFEKRERFEI